MIFHAIFSKVALYQRGGKVFSKFVVRSASHHVVNKLVDGEWKQVKVSMPAKSYKYPNHIDGIDEKHAFVVSQYLSDMGIPKSLNRNVRRMACADAGKLGRVWTLESIIGFNCYPCVGTKATKPGISAKSLPDE